MAELIKGTQCSLAFTLKDTMQGGGTLITPDNVDGVRIALGNQVSSYPDGTLTYSTDDQTWRFPLTQANSYAFVGNTVNFQVEVKIGDDIFPSAIASIKVLESMFRTRWDA